MNAAWRTRLCAALLVATGAAAASDDLPVPEELHPALEEAAEFGTLLFRHDVAGARATDELKARRIFKRDKRIRGWLTSGGETGDVMVTIVGDVEGEPRALYRVRVPPEGKAGLEKLDAPEPLDTGSMGQWRARESASQALAKRDDLCSDHYNTVVLTRNGTDGDRHLVYLLAATTKPRTVVAGGHFRYEYAADGVTEIGHRKFTQGCMTMTADRKQGTPVSLMLMHVLDPTPTEIHVFLGLLHGQRMAIGTSKYLWSIEGTRISLVNQRD